MEIKGETKIKETYEWVIADRTTWIDALRQVAAYWEKTPDLGTPAYVTLSVDRDFNGPDKLKIGVEWSPLKTETYSDDFDISGPSQ